MSGVSGTFSWKEWGIQKAISLSVSIITCGLSCLAGAGQIAVKAGSMTVSATFCKLICKTVFQFAFSIAQNYATEKIMELINEKLVNKIVTCINTYLLNGLYDTFNKVIENMYSSSKTDEEFERNFGKMKTDLEKSLGINVGITKNMDKIGLQITTALQRHAQNFADILSKSTNKYAKTASVILKAYNMCDKMYKIVEAALHLVGLIKTIQGLMDRESNKSKGTRVMKPAVFKTRIEQLKKIITDQIFKKLSKLVENAVRKCVTFASKFVGKAFIKLTKSIVNEYFKGENPLKKVTKSETGEMREFNDGKLIAKNDGETKRNELQNQLTNPNSQNLAVPNSDSNRPLGKPDLRMLADLDRRNIEIFNEATGKTETLKPGGWKKIPAFFKQSVKLKFRSDADNSIGHYVTGRGNELYVQANGRMDCALIAINESLGKTVNEGMLIDVRAKMSKYIEKHPERYQRYQKEAGVNPMIGGNPSYGMNSDYNDVVQVSHNACPEGETGLSHPKSHAPPEIQQISLNAPKKEIDAWKSEEDSKYIMHRALLTPEAQSGMQELNNNPNLTRKTVTIPIASFYIYDPALHKVNPSIDFVDPGLDRWMNGNKIQSFNNTDKVRVVLCHQKGKGKYDLPHIKTCFPMASNTNFDRKSYNKNQNNANVNPITNHEP